jgi:hypothetical protein
MRGEGNDNALPHPAERIFRQSSEISLRLFRACFDVHPDGRRPAALSLSYE